MPTLADEALDLVEQAVTAWTPRLAVREVGQVVRVGGGIAHVTGLPGVRSEELLRFEGGVEGIAWNLDEHGIGVILLGEDARVKAGSMVQATGRIADTPVGQTLLGRVIDATGRPLDGGIPPQADERWPMERPAPAILDRAPVTVPLQTGLKVVDALIPVGRGQRELILGDRQTGKTALAVDTILNQRGAGVICIYCAIGQRGTAVAQVIDELRTHDAMDYSIVVVAAGEDPPGLQFVTPYAATSMAEWFMRQGHDVLIVYDDLTRHARAYRELSLLLHRPPGREAYPGDIFYIHARLLERATHLRNALGGGSLTALPIAETQAQNMAAYIPTNLISITDGQLYLSPQRVRKALMPAVDVGKSVSRVGGKAQLPAYRAVAGDLRLAYTQFEELETFARFGTRLDERTRSQIERGRRVRAILRQSRRSPLTPCQQMAVLLAVNAGLFDSLDMDALPEAEALVHRRVPDQLPELCQAIESGEKLTDAMRQQIIVTAREAISSVP